MVADKEQEMKYFISNKTETGKKFGKWHYFADSKCKLVRHAGDLYIYFGYLVEDDLEARMIEDFDALSRANGSFTAVRVSEDRVDVIVDYFARYKVFAHQNNGLIEITNNFGLLSLTRKDIDITESAKRMSVPDEYTQRPHLTNQRAGTWTDYVLDLQGVSAREYEPAAHRTVFKNVYMLEPGTQLTATDQIHRTRLVDYKKDFSDAFKQKSRFHNTTQLEDYIHECMSKHADTIKNNYAHIHSTVSEGIDSVLQTMYFKDQKHSKSMYKFVPSMVPEQYKQKIMDHLKDINIEHFDLDRMDEYCKSLAQDPSCLDFDTLPTYRTIKNSTVPIDMMMYGAGGDEVFLKRRKMVELQAFELSMKGGKDNLIERYNNLLKTFDNTYSARRNIDTPEGLRTLQEQYSELDWNTKLSESLDYVCRQHTFPEDIRDTIIPATLYWTLYCRQISTETDTEISSLYHDLNIAYEVMKLPLDARLESTVDVGLQRNILKRHWNFDFQTPFKDQAVFNTYKAIKPYYRSSIAHVLKDNLRELLDNEG